MDFEIPASLDGLDLDALAELETQAVAAVDALRDGVVGSAWLRNMRKTGHVTYSGLYGVQTLPGSRQPSVRVVFPLPLGSLQSSSCPPPAWTAASICIPRSAGSALTAHISCWSPMTKRSAHVVSR